MNYTFGVEHEWADWDIRTSLPNNCLHNKKDGTIVNSNGIANDPSGRSYWLGGEINTPPTDTPEGQVEIMNDLLHIIPAATVNYRSNLHLHIHVPGLRDNLTQLKRIQTKIVNELPFHIQEVEPIIEPTEFDYPDVRVFEGAMKRYKRMLVSHHTFPKHKRYEQQMKATTPQEFFEAEVNKAKDGRLLWHFTPRACVNLRQLLDTNTIEFRHFPGALNGNELLAAFTWCIHFLQCAIDDIPLTVSQLNLPKFKRYDHRLECGYQATTFHPSSEKKKLTRNQIEQNIQRILTEGVEVFYS